MKPLLSDRFQAAFVLALEKHKNQKRKGSGTPYFAHLMSVCALVLENGGSEDQAIAALLHDAPEDQGGMAVLEEIREAFGEDVARIVDGCTDTYLKPKPDWMPRKQAYLDKLKTASEDILLVSLADKVHNARCIVRDIKLYGDEIWSEFNGGKEGTIWYYRELAEILDNSPYPALSSELRNMVNDQKHG
jgi:(p)ppGpp synthase/HD superfamily hydrolase